MLSYRRKIAVTLLARWAAMIAVALWVLFPSGTMPGRTANGELTIMLCTGDGPVSMTVDDQGQPLPAEKGENGDHASKPCSFAAAHLPSLAPLGEVFAHVTATFVESAPLPVAISARQSPDHSFAEPRAPPAFL